MATRMYVRQLKSVGFVDAGACEGADIIIAKRADRAAAGGESVVVDAVAATPPDVSAEVAALQAEITALKAGKVISAANMARIQSAMDALAALLQAASKPNEDMEDEHMSKVKKSDDAAPETPTVEPETPAVAPVVADSKVEDTEKADIMKRLEDAEKRANETALALKAEQDARLTEKSVVRVEKEYAGLPIKATEFGAVMKRATDSLSAEDFAEIDRVLKAASELVRQSKAFSEIGASGGESNTATDRIDAKARELVTKGDFATFEQAWTHISKNDSELRAALKAERARSN